MAPEVENRSYELHVLRAAADGVDPALLLKAPGGKAEYLFNVPDGFSRLALEHKLTPSARLSCVLLTSLLPTSTGGLGGLLLRLRNDGHGQFQMIGPRGSSSIMHSLRHICRWQHPKVFVSECCDNGPLPVFEDEHIVIVPLLAGDQSTGCPWCRYASSETATVDPPKKLPRTTSEPHDYSLSRYCSGSSTSSDGPTATRFLQSTSDADEGHSLEKRQRMFNSDSQKDKDLHSKELNAADRLNFHFSNAASPNIISFVRGHTHGEGHDLKGYQSILPQRRKRDEGASNQPILDLDEAFFGHVRSELNKSRKTKPVQCSGKVSGGSSSRPSMSRNKKSKCSTQLCFKESNHGRRDFQSSLLDLTPNVSPQDDDMEDTFVLKDIAEEGNRCSPCNSYSGEMESGYCSELQHPPCSTSMEDSGNAQKFTLRRCNVASGLEADPATSDNSILKPAAGGNWMIGMAAVLPVSACGEDLLKCSSVPMKPYDWRICNLQQNDLPQLAGESNPVYGLTPCSHVIGISSLGIERDSEPKKAGGGDSYDGEQGRVLGYLTYLRKLNTAVLIVDCKSGKSLESLRRHSALSCIYHRGSMDDKKHTNGKMHTMSAAVHLTPHSLVQTSDYQTWMQSFTSPVHVVMNDGSPEFGFQSSLATLKRLNNIHQVIFPLPPNINSSRRTTQPTQVLGKSNVTIVDAEILMGLKFCEEGTALSHASVDYSIHPLNVQQTSSPAKPSEQAPDLLFTEVDVQRSDTSTFPHLSPNIFAAARIKRGLLDQKKSFFSIGTDEQNRKTIFNDSMVGINCTRQDGVFETCLLPSITRGNQDSSELCPIEDNMGEDVDRALSLHGKGTIQVVLNDEQRRTSPLEVSRNHGVISQTRGLTLAQEYMKLYDPVSEFQLIFLGTGCAEPSKKRGSSGILLQVRGAEGAMLLDAGEGAAGQLFRRFGEQGARTIISSLQCLWLSHKHGDHALGVLSILQTRSPQAAPLTIIGPHKVGQWLSEVRDTCTATGCPSPRFTYIHCDELSGFERYRNNQQHGRQLREVLDAMQLQSMWSVKVVHCYDAYGIILSGRHGWRVVYSGDTRPCKQLIEAGQGCTLLIHEATFEDSLVEQAKNKRHSTVSEAVEVGSQMHAHHIILTHFSQRYPETVAINGDHKKNISLAFDGMVVSSRLLDLLGKLLPLIRIACQKTVKISPITSSGQQSREGSSMPVPIWHDESTRPVVQQKTLSYMDASDTKETPVTKHKRWLSHSDDEAEGQCLEGHAVATSIRWSSDSDEEAESNQQGGLPMRHGSKDRTSEMSSKPNFFWGKIGPSFNSKGIVGCSPMQTGSLKNICKVERASSDILETSGFFGGKHLRWIDSDSEDG